VSKLEVSPGWAHEQTLLSLTRVALTEHGQCKHTHLPGADTMAPTTEQGFVATWVLALQLRRVCVL